MPVMVIVVKESKGFSGIIREIAGHQEYLEPSKLVEVRCRQQWAAELVEIMKSERKNLKL